MLFAEIGATYRQMISELSGRNQLLPTVEDIWIDHASTIIMIRRQQIMNHSLLPLKRFPHHGKIIRRSNSSQSVFFTWSLPALLFGMATGKLIIQSRLYGDPREKWDAGNTWVKVPDLNISIDFIYGVSTQEIRLNNSHLFRIMIERFPTNMSFLISFLQNEEQVFLFDSSSGDVIPKHLSFQIGQEQRENHDIVVFQSSSPIETVIGDPFLLIKKGEPFVVTDFWRKTVNEIVISAQRVGTFPSQNQIILY